MDKKILVVDDSESIRELITITLQEDGYQVQTAINGVDAIQYLDGRAFDLVLTDLHMPEMDGIELIKKIRTIDTYKTIPILFLTTESQAEKKSMAKQAGATGWIIKPFVPDKLKVALKKVLR